MLKQALTIALALLAATSAANAEVTGVYWDSPDGDPVVANSVQNTLFATMTKDWTNAVILIDLTAGSLLNPVAPPPPFDDNRNYGANENDSWTDSPNSLYGYPTNISFDVDGSVAAPYSTYEGYIDWFDTTDNGPVTDGIAARIYATDTAQGSWLVKMYDRDSAGVPTVVTGFVTNGAFAAVPEPTSVAMLLAVLGGVIGLTVSRKRG